MVSSILSFAPTQKANSRRYAHTRDPNPSACPVPILPTLPDPLLATAASSFGTPSQRQQQQQQQHKKRRRPLSVLDAYDSSSTHALPSLARFNQYPDDDSFFGGDGAVESTNGGSDEAGWDLPARAGVDDDRGRGEGGDEASLEGGGAVDVDQQSRETKLSALLVGLHRRVMWRQMVCSTVNPITPERRALYLANPG